MVYDEKDAEESVLLRKISGGHKSQISALMFDFHLSLVATGSFDGDITYYDFEMSRVEGILIGHTQ